MNCEHGNHPLACASCEILILKRKLKLCVEALETVRDDAQCRGCLRIIDNALTEARK